MKTTFQICALVLASLIATVPAHAQYPDKPVRFIVPYPPGQATDVIARLVAEELIKVWKKQIVVDNRPGGAAIDSAIHAASVV